MPEPLVEKKHIGIVEISFTALEHLLKLPPGHKVKAVGGSPFEGRHAPGLDIFQVLIEGEQMPEVGTGEPILNVNLEYSPQDFCAKVVSY